MSRRLNRVLAHAANMDTSLSRAAMVLCKYGLAAEQFSELLDKQSRNCAICGRKNTQRKELCVDHCHASGRVRGLLCNNCNTGLGMFKDRPDLLIAAWNYLRKYQ